MDQLLSNFKETEARYNELKAQLGRGEIAVDVAKSEIKKLMIQDDTGTYWMMGGKSGKWYKHEDNQWREADPFAELFPGMQEPEPEPEPAVQFTPVPEPRPEPQPEPQHEAQLQDESPVTLETYNIDDKVARHETVIEKAQDVDLGAFQTEEPAKYDAGAGMEVENGEAGAGESLFSDIDVGNGSDSAPVSHEAYDPNESSGISFADDDSHQEAAASAGEDEPYQLESSAGVDFGDDVPAADGQEGDVSGKTDMSFEAVGSASTMDASAMADFGQDSAGLHQDFGGIDEDFHGAGQGGAATIEFAGSDAGAEVGGLDAGGLDSAGQEAGGLDFGDLGGGVESDTNRYATIEADVSSKPGISIDLDSEEPAGAEVVGQDVIESEITAEPAQDFQSELDYQAEQSEAPALEEATPGLVTAVPSAAAAPAAPAAQVGGADLVNCVICQSRIPPISVYCSFCGANQKELDPKKARKARKKQAGAAIENELVLKSINIMSFLFFLGGLGLVAGVILGAVFGVVMDFLYEFHADLPLVLQEARGGGIGGLIFAAIGGIGGFIAMAFLSLVLSAVYNLISFVFGGVRFKIKS